MPEAMIGIDLGTTNSCVSIAGDVEGGYRSPALPGISVITDELRRKTTPSVLAYDGDARSGSPYIIGHAAKQRFGQYPPVMFAKRHMGTTRRFQLAEDRWIAPEEVSAEILRYLKGIAEKRLGRPVSRAIVTVPAYFGTEQKQLTAEAMAQAGFITAGEENIIIEPVAAAFAYTATAVEENLKIMVFDLGGGTFDVTILEKSGEFIEVSAFGGDHALGGYNFDLLLADHILAELRGRGYRLELDTEANQGDRVRYSKLLLEAERAKIELSQPSVEEVYLRRPALFEDQAGEAVDLDMRIGRETFEGLIAPLVEQTIEESRTVLDKSDLGIEAIDHIVMVGGSSFIPLIQRRLEEAFGRRPELFEPDLCVAIGAAIYAGTLKTVVHDRVVLALEPLPHETSSPTITVHGKVSQADGQPPGGGYEVTIGDAAGAVALRTPLDDDGGYFVEVALVENAENRLWISVLNPRGEVEAATEALVRHSGLAPDTEREGSGQTGVITLPKSIYIKKRSGPSLLAEEGVELPYRTMEEFKIGVEGRTAENGSYDLNVELMEGDLTIGVVTVNDIPGTIQDEAKVEVSLTINQDSRMIASAYIPSVDREGKASFRTSRVEVLTVPELRRKLEELSEEWETLSLMLDAAQRARYGPQIDRMFRRAKQFLGVTEPDTSELTRIVLQIRNMMAPLVPQELDPSREVFEGLCREVSGIIQAAEKRSEEVKALDFGRSLGLLQAQALKAYDRLDQQQWGSCYRQIQQLGQRVEAMVKPPPKLPPPAVLILQFMELLKDMERQASKLPGDDPRRSWALGEIKKLMDEINKISKLGDQESQQQELVALYLNRIVPLLEKLEMPQSVRIIIQ